MQDNGSSEQLKTDLRDATSDANTTESQAVTFKESHSQWLWMGSMLSSPSLDFI